MLYKEDLDYLYTQLLHHPSLSLAPSKLPLFNRLYETWAGKSLDFLGMIDAWICPVAGRRIPKMRCCSVRAMSDSAMNMKVTVHAMEVSVLAMEASAQVMFPSARALKSWLSKTQESKNSSTGSPQESLTKIVIWWKAGWSIIHTKIIICSAKWIYRCCLAIKKAMK